MRCKTWHAELDCPSLDEMRLLTLSHWTFDHRVAVGEMIVAREVADDVLSVFERLLEDKFPIAKIRLLHHYGGDDEAAMADNNSSAFNCRALTGGGGLSQHAFGTAVDINPLQNPYHKGDVILPPAGESCLDRSVERPGMIMPDGPVVRAFADVGWSWGGDYQTLKDYQHFSASGG